MSLTKDDILYIAELARLHLPANEIDHYTRHAIRILAHVEQLNRLDTSRVEPTAHAVHVAGFLRDDAVKSSVDPTDILANAPARDGDLFKVPKVL